MGWQATRRRKTQKLSARTNCRPGRPISLTDLALRRPEGILPRPRFPVALSLRRETAQPLLPVLVATRPHQQPLPTPLPPPLSPTPPHHSRGRRLLPSPPGRQPRPRSPRLCAPRPEARAQCPSARPPSVCVGAHLVLARRARVWVAPGYLFVSSDARRLRPRGRRLSLRFVTARRPPLTSSCHGRTAAAVASAGEFCYRATVLALDLYLKIHFNSGSFCC